MTPSVTFFRLKAVRQILEPKANESFLAYRYAEADFYAPYHFHPEIEIVMIEAGRGLRVVGDHTGSFTPMNLCMFGGGLPHIFRADETTHGAVSLVVQFHADLLEDLLGLPEMNRVSRLFDQSQQGIQFSSEMSVSVRDLMTNLTTLSSGSNKLVQLLHLLEFLANDEGAEVLASSGYTAQISDQGNRRIAKVWELILEAEGEEPSQAEVAEELKMTVSAFSRMFRRATGRTYSETLTDLRLGRACRMMIARDVTIAEAGYHAGYNNLSIFNRHFKKRYGMTPRQWRASMGAV